ncbi:hypothetical protein [Amaricoccus sp.]|nr:hypothetical protein [Amaricoccus sp.]MBP7001685.1 hypothetical protein [Amaricoccus sp.]
MSDAIAWAVFAGFIFLLTSFIVRCIRRGFREGFHFRAPWVRRLHGDLD